MQRSLQLRPSLSIYLKKYRFPLCAARNIVMTLRHSANKNWGIVRLRIRASSSYYGGLNRSSGHIMKFSVFTKRHTTTLIYVPYLPKVPMYIVLHTCYAYLPRGSYVGTYCRYALYHGRCMSYIAMYGVPTYMSS